MDVLANLLDGPRGRGAFLLRSVWEPPWSIRMADGAPLGLVAMVRGSAWMVCDAGDVRHLPEGAVALIKGPDPVTLASEPGTAVQVVCGPGGRRTTPDGTDIDVGDTMRLGRGIWGNNLAGSTRMLLGCYQLRGEVSRRILDALPSQVVLEPASWDSPLVALLDREVGFEEPGRHAVLDRLFDLLLVSVVRTWLNQLNAEAPGWYSAYLHPVVGPALRLLHEALDRGWTVAALAAEVGVSRSVLARCFTQQVGVPPMAYLKQWRLDRAADLLLDPELTIDAIADRVGYSDGSTLSTLFKTARGISPQEYRRVSADAEVTAVPSIRPS